MASVVGGASGVAKTWARLRRALGLHEFVGADGNGNHYYKWFEKNAAGEVVERRRVKVQGSYINYDPKDIPPQWRMWLHKTRKDAPTEEEMARAAQRAALMAQRVSAIQEREMQRRYRAASLGGNGQQADTQPDSQIFIQQLGGQRYDQACGDEEAGAAAQSQVQSSGRIPGADAQEKNVL